MSIEFRPKRAKRNSPLYRITADFKDHIITVHIHDATTKRTWRSEFSQKNFPKQPIFDIAQTLIEAINSMNDKNSKKVKNFVPIGISEYYKWCYVTVKGTDLPTFALRPVVKAVNVSKFQRSKSKQNLKQKKSTTIKRQMTF